MFLCQQFVWMRSLFNAIERQPSPVKANGSRVFWLIRSMKRGNDGWGPRRSKEGSWSFCFFADDHSIDPYSSITHPLDPHFLVFLSGLFGMFTRLSGFWPVKTMITPKDQLLYRIKGTNFDSVSDSKLSDKSKDATKQKIYIYIIYSNIVFLNICNAFRTREYGFKKNEWLRGV